MSLQHFTVLFFLVAAGFYSYFHVYHDSYIPKEIPIGKGVGGLYKFLTTWNVHLQSIYYDFALLATLYAFGISGRKSANNRLIAIRDYIFGTLVFPSGIYVSLVFWSLYNYDRQLIFPKSLDDYVPVIMNHVWHTAVAIFPVIEVLSVHHYNYPTRVKAYIGLFGFYITYMIWILYLAHFHKIWVYPFLKVISNTGFVVFVLISGLFAALSFEVGLRLERLKYSHIEEVKKLSQKKD